MQKPTRASNAHPKGKRGETPKPRLAGSNNTRRQRRGSTADRSCTRTGAQQRRHTETVGVTCTRTSANQSAKVTSTTRPRQSTKYIQRPECEADTRQCLLPWAFNTQTTQGKSYEQAKNIRQRRARRLQEGVGPPTILAPVHIRCLPGHASSASSTDCVSLPRTKQA